MHYRRKKDKEIFSFIHWILVIDFDTFLSAFKAYVPLILINCCTILLVALMFSY